MKKILVAILITLPCICFSQQRELDTVKVYILYSIKGCENCMALSTFAYSIREKHNTDEGQIDPYHSYGYVSSDYWVHVRYIGRYKTPLPSNYIVWDSKDINW